MPEFRFAGDHPRTFPELTLDVEPGAIVTFDENPDPRWFQPVDKPAKEKSSGAEVAKG